MLKEVEVAALYRTAITHSKKRVAGGQLHRGYDHRDHDSNKAVVSGDKMAPFGKRRCFLSMKSSQSVDVLRPCGIQRCGEMATPVTRWWLPQTGTPKWRPEEMAAFHGGGQLVYGQAQVGSLEMAFFSVKFSENSKCRRPALFIWVEHS